MTSDRPMSRQQRRALERQNRKRKAKSTTAENPWRQQFDEQSQKLQAVLSNRVDTERASRAADLTLREFDQSLERTPPDVSIDCRRGCAFCCHGAYVAVSAPEAILIAKAIRTLPPDQRESTIARLNEADNETRGQSIDQRFEAMRSCPLLVDNECAIYANRPLTCRSRASHDVRVCEANFHGGNENVPTPFIHVLLRDLCAHALQAAAMGTGLAIETYEMNAAVRIALETPDAEERWLSGEDIFRDAVGHESAYEPVDVNLVQLAESDPE